MFCHNKPLFRARSKGLGRLAHSVYTGSDFRRMICKNWPLSKMADCYKREARALGTSTFISTEEANFYGGS